MFPFSPLLTFWAHKAAGRQNIQVNRVRTLIAQTWTAHTTVSSSPLYCGSLSLTVTVSTAFFFFFFSFLFLNVQYPLPTPLIGWSPKLWQLSTPSTSQSLWPGSSPSTYELAGLCWGGGRLTHTHPGVCLHALSSCFWILSAFNVYTAKSDSVLVSALDPDWTHRNKSPQETMQDLPKPCCNAFSHKLHNHYHHHHLRCCTTAF